MGPGEEDGSAGSVFSVLFPRIFKHAPILVFSPRVNLLAVSLCIKKQAKASYGQVDKRGTGFKTTNFMY